MKLSRRALGLAAASGPWAASLGCARKAPSHAEPPAIERLHLSPLSDLFAAAGLSYLISFKPPALEYARTTASALAALAPPASLDKLSAYLGLDPRLADEIVIAGYEATILVGLRVAHDPALVRARFVERLSSAPEIVTDGPSITRVAGLVGKQHRSMADLNGDVVLYEYGPSGPLQAAVAFARSKIHRAKPALAAEPLASLRGRMSDAPLLVFAPNPTHSPWSRGAHGLLSRALALGLAAEPDVQGLRVRAYAFGAWDDPPTEALRRIEATMTDLAQSPLGKLTKLDAPVVPYSYSGDRELIHIEAVLDATALAEGLHAATGAELREIFSP